MKLHVAGLDLGQAKDYTALSVLKAVATVHPITLPGRDDEYKLPTERTESLDGPPASLTVVGLERYALGTPYPQIVEHVMGRLALIPQPRLLAVDATGVGAAVVDLFAALGAPLVAVTITGGQEVSAEGRAWRVPKRDLVHGLLVALQQSRFIYPVRHQLTAPLIAELTSFELKVNAQTGHDQYEAWRESAHDDLVLATAIAAWVAEMFVQAHYEQAMAALLGDTKSDAARVDISPV